MSHGARQIVHNKGHVKSCTTRVMSRVMSRAASHVASCRKSGMSRIMSQVAGHIVHNKSHVVYKCPWCIVQKQIHVTGSTLKRVEGNL